MDVDTPPEEDSTRTAVDLESRIMKLCETYPKGLPDKVLQSEIPNVEAQQRVMAINRLLSRGQIELLKQGSNQQLVYRLRDPLAAKNVKGADAEEKLVYQVIEEAGNKGIWTRNIRFKCNLLLTQVNKILKSLESKKLIKAIKSVAAAKKKVYMLYNLEPDRSVTGGSWYCDQDFELEFVDVLNQQCHKFLLQKAAAAEQQSPDPIVRRHLACASSVEILRFISELGVSKVQLSLDDIESILDTLVYDGKVEKTMSVGQAAASSSSGAAVEPTKDDRGGGVKVYRSIRSLVVSTGLMRIPCGVCPVIVECHVGGLVSPSTCQYMKEWLDY